MKLLLWVVEDAVVAELVVRRRGELLTGGVAGAAEEISGERRVTVRKS